MAVHEGHRMWVKICGITDEEDALAAIALGADAVGFVFAPSARQVTVGTARDIARRLPQEILTVGVFRDQSADLVIDTVLAAGLGGAQLHGHETPAMAQVVRPKVKALFVAFTAGSPSIDRFDEYGADALMLDGAQPGSGQVFDWDLAENLPYNRRLILAGGLTPANVAEAITVVRPWGVDVSTGVEESPGRKDPLKMQAFIRAARSVKLPEHEGDGPVPFDWQESGDL